MQPSTEGNEGLQELEDLLKAAPAGDEEEEPEEETPEKEDEVDPAEAEAAKEAGEPIGKNTEEEEEDMGDNADKSLITQQDFEKSLDRLANLANEGAGSEDRKASLLEKAQKGDLADDERLELYGLLGGKVDQGSDTLTRSVTSGIETNETLRKAYDVSDFLAEQHMELTKSLGMLSDHVEASSQRQHQFNLVLAKAIVDTGSLVKAMSERLGVIASQPARQPLSRGAQPLNKGFVGGSQAPEGMGNQLSKSQIMDAMDELMEKSVEANRGGMSSRGIDIAMEVTKFETTNQMHPVMLAEVRDHIASKGGNGR